MKHISRRTAIMGVAAAATSAGIGFGFWQRRLVTPQNQALEAIWMLNLELPNGDMFALSSLRGKPLVINFWATWCPPCVEELPLLERFYLKNKSKSWQMIAIAADSAKAVNQFLVKMPLSFVTPLAGSAAIDLSRSLGNLSGSLPFTVVINRAGEVAFRHMGKLNAAQIDDFLALD